MKGQSLAQISERTPRRREAKRLRAYRPKRPIAPPSSAPTGVRLVVGRPDPVWGEVHLAMPDDRFGFPQTLILEHDAT